MTIERGNNRKLRNYTKQEKCRIPTKPRKTPENKNKTQTLGTTA